MIPKSMMLLPYLKFMFHVLKYPLMEFKAIDRANEVYQLICEKAGDVKHLS